MKEAVKEGYGGEGGLRRERIRREIGIDFSLRFLLDWREGSEF
jgi:hypothetical protein